MKIETRQLVYSTIFMVIGSLVFKTLPEYLYGNDILFDASRHIMTLSLGLYFIYAIFIQKKENWKLNYVIFSAMLLGFMGVQRILSGEHNEYGVLLGYALAGLAVFVPLWKEERR